MPINGLPVAETTTSIAPESMGGVEKLTLSSSEQLKESVDELRLIYYRQLLDIKESRSEVYNRADDFNNFLIIPNLTNGDRKTVATLDNEIKALESRMTKDNVPIPLTTQSLKDRIAELEAGQKTKVAN